jgi:C-terminal processing protease CtpA/Prc
VGDREAGRPYAAVLRDGVRRLDGQGACGWIVDLRGNSGGNVWPMIDGLGALLGEPPFLVFDVPGQGRFPVLYKDGVAYQEGGFPPYAVEGFRSLRDPLAPVALLIDKDTASSAEALAVAFSGRPNVRRFGQPTADYITVNNPAELPDGARLYLTVGWNMDRTGRRYTSALQPDVTTRTAGDAPIHAAASWLAATPACADR